MLLWDNHPSNDNMIDSKMYHIFYDKLEPQGALIAHLSIMSTSVISYINVSKIWLRNGTKNNNTSSCMLLDHCYALSMLL